MKSILDESIHAFGNLCKELRTQLNCTCEEFSTMAGVCKKTISRVEDYKFINLYNSVCITITYMIYFSTDLVAPIFVKILLRYGANITHRSPEEFGNLRVEDALTEVVQNIHDDYKKRENLSEEKKATVNKLKGKNKKK